MWTSKLATEYPNLTAIEFDFVNALTAAVASFIFGSAWYGVLGKVWMQAASLAEEMTKPKAGPMLAALGCQILMALILGVMLDGMQAGSIKDAVAVAVLLWIGLVLTTQIVNHRFQGRPWSLTWIDSGHWLGVLVIQALTLSFMNS